MGSLAGVHGSRTHPPPRLRQGNRFEDGEDHRIPSTPVAILTARRDAAQHTYTSIVSEPDGGGFHGSPELLAALGAAAFPRRRCQVILAAHGGQAFRVLAVDGRQLNSFNPFPLGLRALLAAPSEGLPSLSGPAYVYGDIAPIAAGVPVPVDAAPLVDWRGFASWDQYVARLRLNERLARTRALRNQLAARFGPIQFGEDDTTPGVIELALAWKAADARRHGWLDVFSRPVTARIYHALQEDELQSFTTLRAGGRVVAAAAWTRWRGVLHFRFIANDPAFAHYSAGTSLTQHLLEMSCRAGDHEFDFQVGNEAYKLRYSTHYRDLVAVPSAAIRAGSWRVGRLIPRGLRRPLRRAILRR